MDFRIVTGPAGIQGTPEWLAFRKGKIGASHAPCIMGIGFQTPLQLWEEIVFDKPRKKTPAMERGVNLEPRAREWINKVFKVDYEPKVIQSLHYPDLIASLDGYFEMNGKPHILEIKCPGVQDHQEAVSGRIPAKYFPQLQHQMMVANLDNMYYCSYDGEEGVMVVVERDKRFCKQLLREELLFLNSLEEMIPPKPCEDDWLPICDPEKFLKSERMQEVDRLINELVSEREQLKSEIKEGLEHPRCKIGNLKIQKVTRKGSVDYGKIEILNGVDLERYRKPSVTYWEFS